MPSSLLEPRLLSIEFVDLGREVDFSSSISRQRNSAIECASKVVGSPLTILRASSSGAPIMWARKRSSTSRASELSSTNRVIAWINACTVASSFLTSAISVFLGQPAPSPLADAARLR
jgi:hypothetical protein